MHFHIAIRPFAALAPGGLTGIERKLMERGAISTLRMWQLTNPRGVQRPAVAPFLRYMVNTELPKLVQTALETKLGKRVTVTVAKPWMV